MKDFEGNEWNPVLSDWAQKLKDEISGTQYGVFHTTGICPGCGDMINKIGKHNSVFNSCPGVITK